MWPVLVIAIASKNHVPVGNIGNGTKAVVESGALPNGMGDINNDANSADINEVAATGGPKKRVDI